MKDRQDHYRLILFASYGSRRGAVDVVGTLNNIQPHQRMSMHPTRNGMYYGDHHIPGIAFLLDEYHELVAHHQRFKELPILEDDLRDWIFEASSGHIGAITSLFKAITWAAKPDHHLRMSIATFFQSYSSPEDALKSFSIGRAFDRGLPEVKDLRGNALAVDFCKKLLQLNTPSVFRPGNVPAGAQAAHKQGWLTSEEGTSEDDLIVTMLDFPSLLHRSRMSYLLFGSQILDPHVSAMTLLDFICPIIDTFSSNGLLQPTQHTTGPHSLPSIPEAQWQDLFYTGVYKVTGGRGIWISPEYGTGKTPNATGRIDFFVSAKKWGIELLREGDRIADHLARFAEGGAYDNWIQNGEITDYIVLDFRTRAQPKRPFPQEPKLFHVTFADDFSQYVITNNVLEEVKKGTLLA
ncbi:hypothetical protein K438DRAFT_1956999 [Mycena galopus ATCC 62051]|nr:hypothetical protein K438DRAFT_1956999 [Mycena galopus ATCC 62051]